MPCWRTRRKGRGFSRWDSLETVAEIPVGFHCFSKDWTCWLSLSSSQEAFPIHYGEQYEATLQRLVWKFISRLDNLLPIPDIKQVNCQNELLKKRCCILKKDLFHLHLLMLLLCCYFNAWYRLQSGSVAPPQSWKNVGSWFWIQNSWGRCWTSKSSKQEIQTKVIHYNFEENKYNQHAVFFCFFNYCFG